MKQLNQKGFGGLGVLALVIVVAAVAGIGWYVYHSGQATTKTLQQTNTTSTSTTSPPAKSSATTAAKDDTIQKNPLSKAPKDIGTAILAETKASNPACIKNGAIVDIEGNATDQYVSYTGSFAFTSIGCESGQATLFAKSGGKWQKVGATQFEFACADLAKYQVPLGFLQAVSPDPTLPVKCYTDTAEQDYKG